MLKACTYKVWFYLLASVFVVIAITVARLVICPASLTPLFGVRPFAGGFWKQNACLVVFSRQFERLVVNQIIRKHPVWYQLPTSQENHHESRTAACGFADSRWCTISTIARRPTSMLIPPSAKVIKEFPVSRAKIKATCITSGFMFRALLAPNRLKPWISFGAEFLTETRSKVPYCSDMETQT